MDERIIKIQHVLKKELDDNRYQHTLGVVLVTVTGEVECHETRSRSESEPEEGA